MRKISCLILLLLLATVDASAGIVLVMLRGESRKIEYYQKTGQNDQIISARSEAQLVMKATIDDFTDNFDYCPVYYFIDSNLTLIKEKKFDGILLDKNRNIISPSPLKNTDTNFVIVYYGVPNIEIEKEKNGDGEAVYRSVTYPGDGMVILSHNFHNNSKPFPVFVYEPNVWLRRNKKYTYMSKKFDMGYRQYAKHVEERLINLPDKYFH